MRKTKKKATATWVLLDTHAPAENDCWYAVVQIEPATVDAAVAGLVKLRADGIDVTGLDLDWPVLWFTSEDLAGVKFPTPLGQLDEFVVLDDKLGRRLDRLSGQRTECDSALVTVSFGACPPCIHWECYPKGGDAKVETVFLQWPQLLTRLGLDDIAVAV